MLLLILLKINIFKNMSIIYYVLLCYNKYDVYVYWLTINDVCFLSQRYFYLKEELGL